MGASSRLTSHNAALGVYSMNSRILRDAGAVEAWGAEESRVHLSMGLVREAQERIAECMGDWDAPEDVWLLTERDLADDWDYVGTCLQKALETLNRESLIETA